MIHGETTRGLFIMTAFSAALMFYAPPADAKLVLETRFVSRTGGAEVSVGDVFHFDVFAVVTGRNADLTDEALQSIHGRFISKDVAGVSSAATSTRRRWRRTRTRARPAARPRISTATTTWTAAAPIWPTRRAGSPRA
jgi:hypothetical protein